MKGRGPPTIVLGIRVPNSELPREYLLLSTVFHSENVSSSVVKAHELSEYCGRPAHEPCRVSP